MLSVIVESREMEAKLGLWGQLMLRTGVSMLVLFVANDDRGNWSNAKNTNH